MSAVLRRAGLVLACTLLAVAANAGGTAPAPFTSAQVNQSNVNALGGFGRTQGWSANLGYSAGVLAAVDVLADANVPATIAADVEAPSTTTQARWMYVTVVGIQGGGAFSSTADAVCFRLGPSTDSPALACPATTTAGADGGGYITSAGQTFGPILIRPIQSCTSYDTCHVPIWLRLSSGWGTSAVVHVTMAW